MENKKQVVKNLIKELHAGAKPDEVKEKFKDVLRGIGPTEIAQIEEELVKEGMPREELRKLCEVHLAVFREQLEKRKTEVTPGHPIHTFMEEHKIILSFLEDLKNVTGKLRMGKDFDSVKEEMEQLKRIAGHLMEVEKHNVREENVLFPYLEKHGIKEPPAIMWSEHDELRKKKKELLELVNTYDTRVYRDFVEQFSELADSITNTLSSHIYKENNILYPAGLSVITDQEWKEIREGCDELGYCCFTPEYARGVAVKVERRGLEAVTEGLIAFETGNLSKREIEAILNTLPVDITFVDKEDEVRYFSRSQERIFPRTKAVIGRKVQQCHPQKSIHVVNQILDDFRNGRRNVAEFWIQLKGRLIYIRYFAVRDASGEYLGCLEVTQDITDIKKIEGEKRLL